MSKTQNEHEYLVFDVAEGPKVIIESLNTYGKEGWALSTMINVGADKLVAFIVRSHTTDSPDPEKSKTEKISKLWSSDGGGEE
tara:strand:+ start:17520 stop:17768 length:249 start_codon:yes stop_codon:yes gene_type:complete